MQPKPFAESSEQNKQAIVSILKQLFTGAGQVLEIGSGTGQHAIYFTEQLPHLHWQPTDLADQLPGMQRWFDEVNNPRILPPRELDVAASDWPDSNMDYVFTANTLHIVSSPQVETMFKGVGQLLKSGGLFAQYGPFNYQGAYTSESNARFDQWLKQRDPNSGIRHFEDLVRLAEENSMVLYGDFEMPANNRILVWRRN